MEYPRGGRRVSHHVRGRFHLGRAHAIPICEASWVDKSQLECWYRARMSAFALFAAHSLVNHIATFTLASIARYGSEFGVLLIIVFGEMLAYYAAQLGRTLFEFGSGRRPTLLELAVAFGGIAAALIGMAVMPYLNLSKP